MDMNDHREIGKLLDLFHMQEEAMGSVFWHPKGWTLFRTIENFIRRKIDSDGYVEVKTPQLIDRSLWEASGHWEKFRANMFTTSNDIDGDSSTGENYLGKVLAIKPMNCPGHIQIFNQGIVSYRDMPIRMAEFGSCHRNEPSGSLHGIMRVRAFTQDDAHIFCRPTQVIDEALRFCKLIQDVYKEFGFENVIVKLSTRPVVRAGTDEAWATAELGLAEACRVAGLTYEVQPNEGAFYGPKLEFTLLDRSGHQWQCGTLQYDMVLPERLDATYVEEDGSRKHPVILHRAILGSLERFIGMLLEHYEGNLPMWLAPHQVGIVPVGPQHREYALAIEKELKRGGIRVGVNADDEHFNKRIKKLLSVRVPYVLVVGDRDMGDWVPGDLPTGLSVRERGSRDTTTTSFSSFYHMVRSMNKDDGYDETGVII